MPLLILMRHGDTDYVGKRLAGLLPNIHLNRRGRQQADALAHKLSDLPISAIYSSPIERAIETAEPLAKLKKLQVQILQPLIEINVGDWQGKSISGLQRLKHWHDIHELPARFTFPNGDNFSDKQKAVVSALKELVDNANSQAVIACVSHGDPIKLCLAYFLGLDLNNFQRIAVDPASASFIYFSGAQVRLGPINLVEEIPQGRPKR
jgi:broad specificity phosphatase PhoE